MTLCLKTTLLTRMESGSEDDPKYDQDKEELESDEVPKPVLAKGDLSRKAPRLSEFELEAFYQSSETVSGKPGFTENPMLDASENMEEEKVNKSEYLKVVEANDKMKCELRMLFNSRVTFHGFPDFPTADNKEARNPGTSLYFYFG